MEYDEPQKQPQQPAGRRWMTWASLAVAAMLCPCHIPLYAAIAAGSLSTAVLAVTVGVLVAALFGLALVFLWWSSRRRIQGERVGYRAQFSSSPDALARLGGLQSGEESVGRPIAPAVNAPHVVARSERAVAR